MRWLVFTDPATGAPRLACGLMGKVRVFDPVAGGEALVVLEVGSVRRLGWLLQRPGDGRAAARVRVGREGACLRSGRGRRGAARARQLVLKCEGTGGLQGTSDERAEARVRL